VILRLVAQATLPALLGFLLTLNLLRGGGFETIVAVGATVAAQGALLIGEFAARSRLRDLSYKDRLRGAVWMMAPLGAVGLLILVWTIYVGLGYRAEYPPADFLVGSAVAAAVALGCAVLLLPALVLDKDPTAAVARAARSPWRLVLAVVLGPLYIAVLAGAVWLGPDQLQLRGVVTGSTVAMVRAAGGWLAVAAAGIPLWWLVTRLYVPAPPKA